MDFSAVIPWLTNNLLAVATFILAGATTLMAFATWKSTQINDRVLLKEHAREFAKLLERLINDLEQKIIFLDSGYFGCVWNEGRLEVLQPKTLKCPLIEKLSIQKYLPELEVWRTQYNLKIVSFRTKKVQRLVDAIVDNIISSGVKKTDIDTNIVLHVIANLTTSKPFHSFVNEMMGTNIQHGYISLPSLDTAQQISVNKLENRIRENEELMQLVNDIQKDAQELSAETNAFITKITLQLSEHMEEYGIGSG